MSSAGSDRSALRAFCALLLAVFTVSAAYGIVLPVLPTVVERSAVTAAPADVSRHVGLLTGLYTLSVFLFARTWGRLSDRFGRRIVLIAALSGLGATLLVSALLENLYVLYAERFLSGMFAAAVAPIAMAAAGDDVAGDEARARRFARISMAGIAGFLLGPMLGGLAARLELTAESSIAASRSVPVAAMAALSFLSAFAIWWLLSRRAAGAPQRESAGDRRQARIRTVLPRLLALSFAVALGLAAFEVGTALRGTQALGLDPVRIAVLFAECSLVMFVAQGVVFSAYLGADASRWLIAPLLAIMAAGLILVARTSDFATLLILVAVVAASAGVLLPVLTYWISLGAGAEQGGELGKQTAVASLGQTLGSAATGMLLNSAVVPGAPFVLAGTLLGLGAAASLRMPRLLGSVAIEDPPQRHQHPGRVVTLQESPPTEIFDHES